LFCFLLFLLVAFFVALLFFWRGTKARPPLETLLSCVHSPRKKK
jgi:hypothetical protein